MGRRWNVLVVAGVACFLVGAAIVFLLARDDNDKSASTSASGGTVPVLVAKEAIAAGTTGTDALSKVEVKRVPTGDRSPDALSSPSELSTQLVVAAFGKDEQIRQGGLKRQSTAATSVALAKGKEAVAVSIPFVPGGAGYVTPGDLVNVYQVIPDLTQVANDNPSGAAVPYSTPRVELMLTNVRVLDVQPAGAAPLVTPTVSNNPAGTSATTSPTPVTTSGSNIVILEVDTLDAEKVIFGTTIQKLSIYLTRVGDNPPAGATPGRDFSNQLDEEPDVAFSRGIQ